MRTSWLARGAEYATFAMKMNRILTIILTALFLATPGRSAAHAIGRVYLILWFDTEDYVLDDDESDSVKRLAMFLAEHNVRATFKIVGEKARMLERKGRRDVIAALGYHEIGYHSDLHSQKPLIDEYEEPLGWEAGVQEFNRRERPGFEDVRRILGQFPTTYGQPGASWAPQSYQALKEWGVDVYLDHGKQVGLDGKPFWYGGMLNIFGLLDERALRPKIVTDPDAPGFTPDGDWMNLSEVKANFQTIYNHMSLQPEGGLVSFMFHPCEFVAKADWDIVNFARGANPPSSEWKLPVARSVDVRARAFNFFQDLILYIKSFPNVEFVTASQARTLYEDAAQTHYFSDEEIAGIAGSVRPAVTFQTRDTYTLAPSEVLKILNRFAVRKINGPGTGFITLEGTPYGPSSHFAELHQRITIPWAQFSRTVLDVENFLEKNRQVPSAIWFGSQAVSPESYLTALAEVVVALQRQGSLSTSVAVDPADLAAARYVTDDSAAWQWIVAPDGVRRSNLIALAKLQAWTLKPAKLRKPS